MSTSTVSNPESATSSINGNRTPWGWLVWNDPKWKVGFALGTTEIGNVATIGRGLFCTVSVQPTLVENALFERISRQHCTLEKSMEDGKVTIVNNSQNGTFVNGERVNYLRTRPINHGSVVALCYAGSPASFTFYDNYHRFSDVNFVLNNRYVVMDVLAKGSFGQVCRAIRKHDHTIVAVKTVTPATLGGTFTTTSVGPGGLEALRNEIQILSTTDHPCIIKMVDSSSDVTTSKMFLALELANGGDLQQRLHDVGYLSEPVSRFVFVQLVSAIKYCHGRSPPIVHRDLNPANILLVNADEFARVKIADFGISKRLLCPSTLKTYCGTSLYIAPEVRRQQDGDDVEPYTAAADVWSLGVILHYMLLGRHPSCSRADYTGRSTSTQRGSVLDGPGIATVSDEAHTLIDNMVAIDVGRRHDIETVARCPWLLDEDTMANLRSIVFKGVPIF